MEEIDRLVIAETIQEPHPRVDPVEFLLGLLPGTLRNNANGLALDVA